MTYTVYMHTCLNGKVYVGITRMDVSERWRNNGAGYKKQYFYRAIQKYGWNNIRHEVLFCGLSKEEAEQKECELIALHNSNLPEYGYNIDNGGKTGNRMSEATKEKLRAINTGKRHTQETLIKMSQSQKGRKHSEETKRKIGEKHKGLKYSEESRRKISEAKQGTHLSKEVCAQISARTKGENNPNAKRLYLVDDNGNILKEFLTSQQAQRELGISKNSITAVLKGRQKKTKGYIFIYAENTP